MGDLSNIRKERLKTEGAPNILFENCRREKEGKWGCGFFPMFGFIKKIEGKIISLIKDEKN